jgi:hypothetical protein
MMLLLVPYTKNIYVFQVYQPSKIQNLDKHGNKRLEVWIYCSISCEIVHQYYGSFKVCLYSSDPFGTFTIKSIKNDSQPG